MSSTLDPGDRPGFTDMQPEKAEIVRPIVAGRALASDLAMLIGWIVVTDWLLYQIGTFLAWGVCLAGVVAFLAIVKRGTAYWPASLGLGILLVALSLKLIWCGSWLGVLCGLGLVFCYAMALSGWAPFLPEVIAFVAFVVTGAAERIGCFRLGTLGQVAGSAKPALGIQFLLPVAVIAAFSSLFVLANPDVAQLVGTQARLMMNMLGELLVGFEFLEALFWLASGWLVLGFLYPARFALMTEGTPPELSQDATPWTYYAAFRNTLLSVILLFAGYLIFEFTTLWFQEFPDNFYYAGYAHQGAFWLTVALALATVVLSLGFRGKTLSDPRLASLKRLAIVWSVQNLLLSLAVYNRLTIYIEFNGMTRMRMVGLLGITAVVVGFAMVVIKIMRDRDFVWLLHRQAWVPMLAIVAYAALPVDWMVNQYNTSRVLNNDLAPSVQIIAQRTSAEGCLPLTRLVDVEDPVIRDGTRALLALWARELGLTASGPSGPVDSVAEPTEQTPWQSEYGHRTPWLGLRRGFSGTDRTSATPWHNFQGSEAMLRRRLLELEPKWAEFNRSPERRSQALDAFFQFAYQWY